MERHDAKNSSFRSAEFIWLRHFKMAVLVLVFLQILNSNAEMHSDARPNLNNPRADEIAKRLRVPGTLVEK